MRNSTYMAMPMLLSGAHGRPGYQMCECTCRGSGPGRANVQQITVCSAELQEDALEPVRSASASVHCLRQLSHAVMPVLAM